MAVSFRLFRQLLMGALSLLVMVEMALTITIYSYLICKSTLGIYLPVQLLVLLWTLVSCVLPALLVYLYPARPYRKFILRSPQRVASEAVTSFVLFPFGLSTTGLLSVSFADHFRVVTLSIVSSMPANFEGGQVYSALQVFSLARVFMHLLYIAGLLTTAVLTVFAFDANVWVRDIDSSPSPFPGSLLFGFLFPCFSQDKQPADSTTGHLCLEHCNCTSTSKYSPPDTVGSRASAASLNILVVLPNERQRRESIVVCLG